MTNLLPMRVNSLFLTLPSLLCAIVSVACGSNGTTEAAMDAAQADTAGSGGTADTNVTAGPVVVGAFITNLIAATETTPAHTTVDGIVKDGPSAPAIIWTVVGESGGCKVSKPSAPFCDPICPSGQVCVSNGVCAPDGVALEVGAVRMSGLGTSAITLDLIAGNYALPLDAVLPFPPASEGAAVSVSVPSGRYGAFTIQSRMVMPLVASGTLTMDRGKSLLVTWGAPGQPSVARMQMKLDISHHGGSKGKIECDVEDTGSLEIPATLITQLINLGVAAFPTIQLTRVATGSATVSAGVVTSSIVSSVVLDVKVVGFQSCLTDADCAVGKPCQATSLCTP